MTDQDNPHHDGRKTMTKSGNTDGPRAASSAINATDTSPPATRGETGDQARADSDSPSRAAAEPMPAEAMSDQQQLALAWIWALSELLKVRLPRSGVGFRYGNTDDTISTAIESAIEHDVDAICLYFGGPEENGPTNVVAITHGKQGVTVFENCEVWAFNTRHGAELIAESRRLKLAEGSRLVSKPNNLDEMRARRVAITWDRWRERAFELAARDVPARPPKERLPAAPSGEANLAGGQVGG